MSRLIPGTVAEESEIEEGHHRFAPGPFDLGFCATGSNVNRFDGYSDLHPVSGKRRRSNQICPFLRHAQRRDQTAIPMWSGKMTSFGPGSRNLVRPGACIVKRSERRRLRDHFGRGSKHFVGAVEERVPMGPARVFPVLGLPCEGGAWPEFPRSHGRSFPTTRVGRAMPGCCASSALSHGRSLDVHQRDPERFHRLLRAREGDQKMPVVLNDVRVVDVATADQVEHAIVDEPVLAAG